MTFNALTSLLGKMSDQLQILQQQQFIINFETMAKKFTSMPILEVTPNLNVSKLIEEVGKNSTEAGGTVLSSGGSPVAVIFNAEQASALNTVINFIPAIIQHMKDTLQRRIDFKENLQEWSVEMFKTAGDFNHYLPAFLVVGTIATATGAFLLGKEHAAKQIDQNRPRMSNLVPVFVFGCGIGILIMSAFGASRVSSAFFVMANSLKSYPQ